MTTIKPVYTISEPQPAMAGWFCMVLKDNVPVQKFVGYRTVTAAQMAAKRWIKDNK